MFRSPRIPVPSLAGYRVAFGVEVPSLSELALFPPRTILDLLSLIEADNDTRIELIEWVRLFSDLDGWHECAPALSKKLVVSFLTKSMKRLDVRFMALSRMSEYIGLGAVKLPEVVFDSLDEAYDSSSGDIRSSLGILISLREKDYQSLAKLCIDSHMAPRAYFESHSLYFDWGAESRLAFAVGNNVAANIESGLSYLYAHLGEFSLPILQAALEGFVSDFTGDSFPEKHAQWLNQFLSPFEGKLWDSIAPETRQKLLAIYGSVSFKKLYSLLNRLDQLKRSATNEQQVRNVKNVQSRLRFWMNYCHTITHFRLLLSRDRLSQYESTLTGVDFGLLEFETSPTIVLMVELNGLLVVHFLEGERVGVRFSSQSTHKNMPVMTATYYNADEIASLEFKHYADQVVGWQFYLEKQLRCRWSIIPKPARGEFEGIPRDSAVLSAEFGLPWPNSEMLTERFEKLESWLAGFWKREGGMQSINQLRQRVACEKIVAVSYPLKRLSAGEGQCVIDKLKFDNELSEKGWEMMVMGNSGVISVVRMPTQTSSQTLQNVLSSSQILAVTDWVAESISDSQ